MSDQNLSSALGQVTAFPVRGGAEHGADRRKSLSLIKGWGFIRFCEGDAESFPIKVNFSYDYPTVEYSPRNGLDQLENPNFQELWMSLVLREMGTRVLAEAMSDDEGRVGALHGKGWDMLREEIVRQCECTIEQLINCAISRNFDTACDYIVQCLYYESGLHEAIVARQAGRPILRSA
jgi:hypothetical protein